MARKKPRKYAIGGKVTKKDINKAKMKPDDNPSARIFTSQVVPRITNPAYGANDIPGYAKGTANAIPQYMGGSGMLSDILPMESGINIKKSKRGTFTKAAKAKGESVASFSDEVMANKETYSPAMVKKANFAKNARKWSKAEKGMSIAKAKKTLAAEGRGGDTEIVHVNPVEKAVLKSLGGSGTKNPATGMTEYVAPLIAVAAKALPMIMKGVGAAGAGGGGGGMLSGLMGGGGAAASGSSAAGGGGAMSKLGAMAKKQGMAKLQSSVMSGGKGEEGEGEQQKGGGKMGGQMMKTAAHIAQNPGAGGDMVKGIQEQTSGMFTAKPTMTALQNKQMLENADKMNRGTGYYTGNEDSNITHNITSRQLGVDKFMTGLSKAAAIGSSVVNLGSSMGLVPKSVGKKANKGLGQMSQIGQAGSSSTTAGSPTNAVKSADIPTPSAMSNTTKTPMGAPTTTKQAATNDLQTGRKANTLKSDSSQQADDLLNSQSPAGIYDLPDFQGYDPMDPNAQMTAKKGLNIKKKRKYKKKK